MREHRLAEHHPAEVDAVQAADQFAVHPGLDAVDIARAGPGGVGGLHLGHDPGAVLALARGVRALGHHPCDVVVEADFAAGRAQEAAQRLAQRVRQLEVGRAQQHARVGRPPEHRLAGAVPGKDAVRIGVAQPRDGQATAGREQAGRLGAVVQRAGGGRQRRVSEQPGDRHGSGASARERRRRGGARGRREGPARARRSDDRAAVRGTGRCRPSGRRAPARAGAGRRRRGRGRATTARRRAWPSELDAALAGRREQRGRGRGGRGGFVRVGGGRGRGLPRAGRHQRGGRRPVVAAQVRLRGIAGGVEVARQVARGEARHVLGAHGDAGKVVALKRER